MSFRRPYGFTKYSGGFSALVCIAAVGLAGCGGSSHASGAVSHHVGTRGGHLNATTLERAIAASALAQRHAKATVDCPPAIPVKAGTRFYCVAEVGSRDTPFIVTEHDAKGDVTYTGVQSGKVPLLDSAVIVHAISHSITSKRHLHASVSCPSGIPRQKGLQFVCLATVHGAGTAQFLVSETDSAGHVRYRAR